jgi:hypothetical protein
MSYSQVTVGSTTTLVLAANANRHSLLIQNISTPKLYLGQDSTLSTATGAAVLITYGSFSDESNGAGKCWPGAIYGIADDSTTIAGVWEEEN